MQLSEVLSSIAQHAPNALLLVEARGTIVFANSRAHELLGYAPDQLVGCSVDELVPAGREQRHRQLREDFARGPVARDPRPLRDLAARHHDGHLVPVEIFLDAWTLRRRAIRSRRSVDLAPRKRMEAELRASEAHLRAIIETEPDGVGVIASDDTVIG